MSQPEQPNPVEAEGHTARERDQHDESADRLQAELAKYRLLAEEARNGGNEELANRLHTYVEQLSDQKVQRSVEFWINDAWQRAQDLDRNEKGYEYLYAGMPGYPVTDAVLPKLRQMLLGREDLPTAPEQLEDGSTRYVVPMKAGTWYVERYEPPQLGDKDVFLEVELFKDQSA